MGVFNFAFLILAALRSGLVNTFHLIPCCVYLIPFSTYAVKVYLHLVLDTDVY